MSGDRTIPDLVAALEAAIGQSTRGLQEELFLLVSRLTPMVNVDLLIRNERGQTLLTWRDDEFYGPGWHVPGGIVRFKEHFATRIAEVARTEFGCAVSFTQPPLALNQIMATHRDVRGHFISLLFACRLETSPDPALNIRGDVPINGQWQWHDRCPDGLIQEHEVYRPYLGANQERWAAAGGRTNE